MALFDQEAHECEVYFSTGNTCDKKNIWECVGDDGSTAFRCCCRYGYGDFTEVSGLLASKDNPDKCLDLTMPYVGSGKDFSTGHTVIWDCAGGNPNKEFHFPAAGIGQIKWATHPAKCLGVKDGASFNGNEIRLQDCADANPEWRTFDMSAGGQGLSGPTRIKWVAHPTKCLDLADSKTTNGNSIHLYDCNEQWGAQLFVVKRPVADPNDGVPSLFCVSLMLPFGYEVELMKAQLQRLAGIFTCNAAAVFSNVSINLGPGDPQMVNTKVMPGSLQVQFGGKWHSALNVDIFIRFWDMILADPRASSNEWTVKVDPDAVFFPDRLQQVLRHQYPPTGISSAPVYLNNCYLGMHGPIEVLSKTALTVNYAGQKDSCRNGPQYAHKQEDYYFRMCWESLGIARVDTFNILFENEYACNERPTTRDGRHPCFSRQVSFHPFKSVGSYWQCHDRAVSQKWVAPLLPIAEPPSHGNYHHS